MLNRLQLLGFMIMSTLGGLLGGSIAFGIVSGEFTPALICLAVIVALFSIVFVIGSGSGEKPAEPIAEAKPNKQYLFKKGGLTIKTDSDAITYSFPSAGEWIIEPSLRSRRSGDQHIGGEVLPEFK